MALSEMNWPNFLVIGAGKSGTTSLNNYLGQHPEIFMSSRKEPNFYGFELTKESDLSLEEEILYFQNSVTVKDDYLELFRGSESFKAVGEVSNTYLYHEGAHERIYKYIPSAKLIAIFRQPAERLYSRYLHLAREAKLPDDPFENCLDTTTIWWQRNDLIKEGFYHKNLSKFYQKFKASQIKVFLYEDLKHPESMMKEIFEFLEVDGNFIPDTSLKLNPSGIVKNKTINSIFSGDGIVNKSVKSIAPTKLYKSLKETKLVQRTVSSIRKQNLERPTFDPSLKEKITAIYKDDINKLSKLIDRDLDHWLH